MSERFFKHKRTITTDLYSVHGLCFLPKKQEIVLTSPEECLVQRICVPTGKHQTMLNSSHVQIKQPVLSYDQCIRKYHTKINNWRDNEK